VTLASSTASGVKAQARWLRGGSLRPRPPIDPPGRCWEGFYFGARLMPMLREEARERQRQGGEQGGRTAGNGRSRLPAKAPEANSPPKKNNYARESRAIAGKLVGVGGVHHNLSTRVDTDDSAITPLQNEAQARVLSSRCRGADRLIAAAEVEKNLRPIGLNTPPVLNTTPADGARSNSRRRRTSRSA
jgi:hypothetical protein